jgi:hypothetical protein
MRAFGYARSVPAGVLEAAGARTFDDLRDLPGLLGLT